MSNVWFSESRATPVCTWATFVRVRPAKSVQALVSHDQIKSKNQRLQKAWAAQAAIYDQSRLGNERQAARVFRRRTRERITAWRAAVFVVACKVVNYSAHTWINIIIIAAQIYGFRQHWVITMGRFLYVCVFIIHTRTHTHTERESAQCVNIFFVGGALAIIPCCGCCANKGGAGYSCAANYSRGELNNNAAVPINTPINNGAMKEKLQVINWRLFSRCVRPSGALLTA